MRGSNPWARWAHRDDVRLDQRAGGSQAHRALDALSASQRCRRRCRRSGPRWERAAVARGRRATGSPRRPRTAPRRSGARSPPASRARRPRRPPYAPRAGPRSRRRRSRRASTAAQSSPVIPSHAHLPLRCLTATTTLSITMTTNARPGPFRSPRLAGCGLVETAARDERTHGAAQRGLCWYGSPSPTFETGVTTAAMAGGDD